MGKLRTLAGAGLVGASCVLLVSGCQIPAPAPAASATVPPPSSSAAAASAAESAGSLVVAHSPSTTDAHLARGICRSWQRLRAEYYQHVRKDTPRQLNHWFSSSDWHTIETDSLQLEDDPAYTKLETALGVGTVGDIASVATARQIDHACSHDHRPRHKASGRPGQNRQSQVHLRLGALAAVQRADRTALGRLLRYRGVYRWRHRL